MKLFNTKSFKEFYIFTPYAQRVSNYFIRIIIQATKA